MIHRACAGRIFLFILSAAVLLVSGALAAEQRPASAKAFFAGGCFWCMEEVFEKVPGVISVVSGYMGGRNANPSYEEVSAGGTGHAESVEVTYDRDKISYQELLRVFWHNVDPLTANAQFCDHGTQYRAAIFFQNDEERRLAGESKRAIEDTKRFKEPIVTQIVAAEPFYPAEEYHQDFYRKNPIRYKFYKYNCGRAQRLEDLWGSP
ncbi:MAG TPA: peptide-methionine (S)-S-oxide reductase MsrA [Nitrospiraceae bacterium]|nr:peptide-methionine (S)-S-oxide reductase MsrA [Nitrospiraceae bacterium]